MALKLNSVRGRGLNPQKLKRINFKHKEDRKDAAVDEEKRKTLQFSGVVM